MLFLNVDQRSFGDSFISSTIDRSATSRTSRSFGEPRFGFLDPDPFSSLLLIVEITHVDMSIEGFDGEDMSTGKGDESSIGLVLHDLLEGLVQVHVDHILLLAGCRACWTDLSFTWFTADWYQQ